MIEYLMKKNFTLFLYSFVSKLEKVFERKQVELAFPQF